MKRIVILYFSLFLVYFVDAQNVAINATGDAPDQSAILDIQSTEKGVLLPRMTTSQRDNIASPAEGLIIYNTDDGCLQYYDGTNWSECLGHASNTPKCGTESVNGNYYVGYALDNTNTISIDIEIHQPGTYTIYTDTLNGYYFSTTESFSTIGIYTVTLDGNGTPLSEEEDTFTIMMEGSRFSCNVEVQVTEIKRTCYEYLLAGFTTDGVYRIDPDGPGGNSPVDCYCDMTTDSGGWTLVASSYGAFDDKAISYFSELQTLHPTSNHNGVWDGMRAVISGNSDIRFSAKKTDGESFDVDLAFYENTWYEVLTSGTTDADVCFNEGNGSGQISIPARKNILTGETRPEGDQWDAGYLESEDSCGDTNDFTVDFDNRGMDSNQTDGTDWGEDDGTQKCGDVQGGTYYFFIWVRE